MKKIKEMKIGEPDPIINAKKFTTINPSDT